MVERSCERQGARAHTAAALSVVRPSLRSLPPTSTLLPTPDGRTVRRVEDADRARISRIRATLLLAEFPDSATEIGEIQNTCMEEVRVQRATVIAYGEVLNTELG